MRARRRLVGGTLLRALVFVSLVLVASAGLTACGGGGGGSDAAAPANDWGALVWGQGAWGP